MDRAQRAFLDKMGHAAEADGMSPIASRLFALLLLSEEPRSLDELATALGVSKASVSTDARRLLEKGVVERVTRAHDRHDYYELAPDFYAQLVRSRFARWRRLQSLLHDVHAASGRLAPAVRARMDAIDEIHRSVIDGVDDALTAYEQKVRARALKSATRARKLA
ncbi:MAG TPA: MarR family transcriptional regulator [Gemmatimonadaceae bacterium]|nr:MarR family transcriptional regulator [Gemmatimonadaceae bacterium]